jgi:hypothetical protein
MRLAWLAAIAFIALGCGGREAGTGGPVDSNSSAGDAHGGDIGSTGTATSYGSATTATVLAACPVAGSRSVAHGHGDPVLSFDTQALVVDGVQCYAGRPSTGGACSPDTPACTLCSVPVLCSPAYGPRTFYTCGCSAGGTWSCTVDWQDTATCAPGDGGTVGVIDAGEATDADNLLPDGALCAEGQIVCWEGCAPEACYPGPQCPPTPPCEVPPTVWDAGSED